MPQISDQLKIPPCPPCLSETVTNFLGGANLNRAKLYRANIAHGKLNGADLTEADLSDANLAKTDLTDANLDNTNLEGTILNLPERS